jgi:hypothetical protein
MLVLGETSFLRIDQRVYPRYLGKEVKTWNFKTVKSVVMSADEQRTTGVSTTTWSGLAW